MPKQSSVFTHEQDEVLIDCVSRHPYIYESNNLLHKDISAREKVWREAATKTRKSISECKKRWKNIRDAYLRNMRKSASGIPTNGTFKWTLLSRLTFLSCVTGVQPNNEVNELLEILTTDGSVTTATVAVDGSTDSSNKIEDSVIEIHRVKIEPEDIALSPNVIIAGRKRKMSESDTTLNILGKRLKDNIHVARNMDKHNKEMDDDAVDSFFKSMALSVKQLPPDFIVRAKMDICNIVGKYELAVLHSTYESSSNLDNCSDFEGRNIRRI